MEARIRAGGELGKQRPSGHQLKAGAFAVDNGGSIPHNLLVAPNTASNEAYQRYCRAHDLPPHPGDVVWDPFGGSVTTAAAAQQLGRRWITNDKSLVYLQGGLGGSLHQEGVGEPANPDKESGIISHGQM